MLVTFLLLLTAHLLGDFIFQTAGIVTRKSHPVILLLHVFVVTGLSVLLLGSFPWQIITLIFLSHLLIDYLKNRAVPERHRECLKVFLIDQALHLLVLVILARTVPTLAADSYWVNWLSERGFQTFLVGLVTLNAFILAIPVGGILIAKATQPFSEEIAASPESHALEGLANGGKIIGYLERALVLLFIFVGHPGGIGFLVAAKSILRFGDIKDPAQRKVTEYIIIGTFLSFGWALLISLFAQQAFTAFFHSTRLSLP
jgi:hypothetical protein